MIVLEARERVGGRLLAAEIGGGEIVEVGGQWVGPTQERVLALLEELGIGRFPTFDEGRSVLELEGRLRHYSGTIPRVGPLVLADIALARLRLQRLAARIDPGPALGCGRRGRARLGQPLGLAPARDEDAQGAGDDARRRAHDLGL